MINGGTKMVAFDDSGYTRRDLFRGVLGLGAAAVTGGLANALSGCASDPIADSRFGEYSAKTLVSTTKHDRTSEVDYIRGLRVRKLLKSGDDGLSFVVYRLDVKEKGKEKVATHEKAAEILEASVLRGEDVSGRRLSSYPTLEEALDSVTTIEEFFKARPIRVKGETTAPTPTAITKPELKEEGLGKKVWYETRAPIAVIDAEKNRVVGLYSVKDLVRFAKDTKLSVDEVTNLLNKDLFAENERLREAVTQALRQKLSKRETKELLEETGGTLAYLFDSEYEEGAVRNYVDRFNSGELGAHDLAQILRVTDYEDKDLKKIRMTWQAFDPETLEPVFPDAFGRSYALRLATDKTGKVVADLMRKNGRRV